MTLTKTNLLHPYQQRVNQHLLALLPKASDCPKQLHAAMRYSLEAGGKRLRPALVYLTGKTFGAELSLCDRAAVAVEYIHTYSLIHDDLPAMDDDELRRGKPTCHIAFNEATAILAGDALQALAFEILAIGDEHPCGDRIQMIQALATSISSIGMAGGQALDLEAENQTVTINDVRTIHELKTAALIRASILIGAYSAGVNDANTIELLHQFGDEIGLAFQIQDDILDITASTEALGKPANSDLKQNKATYPSVVGLEEATRLADSHFQQALSLLKRIDTDTTELAAVAALMVKRRH